MVEELFWLGAVRDRELSQIGAVHNAAGYLLAEMLGCEVRYHANSASDVVCARSEDFVLDVEAAFVGVPFKRLVVLVESHK